eukprot:86843_1
MEDRSKLIVDGYIRNHYGDCVNDIINIIFNFYLLNIDSNVLTPEESYSLLTLLYDTLKQQPLNKEIKNIEAKLIFRASEHEFNSNSFKKCCCDKGPTIIIIHNEYNHIFGGYSNMSWPKSDIINDPNAFLFVTRPTLKVFGWKNNDKTGYRALWSWPGYGPVYGKGNDIWICDKCHSEENRTSNGASSSSWDFDVSQLCHQTPFTVQEYEVFAIEME